MADSLYLVRHAKAGQRRLWSDDDVDRPLSEKGRRQARLVAERITKKGRPTTVLSSPYVRCIQTVEPLAERLDVDVTIEHRLGELEPFEPMLDLLADTPNGSVMCSHGDLIPATLAALDRRGAEIRTQPDWRKATVWVLGRNQQGRIVHATVWPPPVL